MRPTAALLGLLLVLAVLPGIVVADQRTGGTIVVEEGETVDGDLTATGGTVVVRGTVEGDLYAYAGTVVVEENATVTGRLRAYAGTVRIAGTVGENAVVYGGSVTLAESGEIDRSFGAAAGEVTLAGTIGGDATVGASTVTLEETAVIEGDLTYDGRFDDRGGQVEGTTLQSSDLDIAPGGSPLFGPVFSVYWMLATLLLGGLLLLAFPDFAAAVVDLAETDPLRVGALGLGVVVGLPLVLLVLALTVVGLPLALVGLVGYLLLLWVGGVYGRYVIGVLLLSLRDIEHRWGALLVGVVVVGLVGLIPYLGPVVRLLVALFGVGAVAAGLRSIRTVVRRERGVFRY